MNHLPPDEFLGMLKDVRPTGDGRWMALCPCPGHDDRTPSLSVRLGDDGRILIHDFGGCDTREVVEALGIQFAQLFPSPAPRPYRARAKAPAVVRQPPPTLARAEEEMLAIARLILGGAAAFARIPTDYTADRLQVEPLRRVFRVIQALLAEGTPWHSFPPKVLARKARSQFMDGRAVEWWARFSLRYRLALREGRS